MSHESLDRLRARPANRSPCAAGVPQRVEIDHPAVVILCQQEVRPLALHPLGGVGPRFVQPRLAGRVQVRPKQGGDVSASWHGEHRRTRHRTGNVSLQVSREFRTHILSCRLAVLRPFRFEQDVGLIGVQHQTGW